MKYALLLILNIFLIQTATSHPVALSWVKANIDDHSINIRFTILLENLVLTHRPEHDEFYNYSEIQLRELMDQHLSVLMKSFYITDSKSRKLKSEFKSIDKPSLEEQVNAMDLMKYEVSYEIGIEHNDPNWEYFNFHHELLTELKGIPSVIFLSTNKKDKQLVNNVEIRPGSHYKVWSDRSNDVNNPSELTSSYFTSTHEGLRHELTLPLLVFKSLSGVTDKPVHESILSYFSKNNLIHYGNEKLKPRLSFIKTLQKRQDENGLIYIDLFYPSTSPNPSSVQINWEDFNWQFRWFDSEISISDSTYQHRFSRFQPEWKIEKEQAIE